MLYLPKALYINIPFCTTPCTFCHYKANISFGYKEVPDDYFSLLKQDMEVVCKELAGEHIASVFFGGGTPSLLRNDQIEALFSILTDSGITTQEASIELYPGKINFALDNKYFTRYSIGAQSLDAQILKKYKRENYSVTDITKLIDNVRGVGKPININLDLMLDPIKYTCEPWDIINEFAIDSLVIYPDTRQEGIERLRLVLAALDDLALKLTNFTPFMQSPYIFTRYHSSYSLYAAIENELLGDIHSVGHNSVSMRGKKSFLKQYVNGKIINTLKGKNTDHRLIRLLQALPVGIPPQAIDKYLPGLRSFCIAKPYRSSCPFPRKDDRENIPEQINFVTNGCFQTQISQKHDMIFQPPELVNGNSADDQGIVYLPDWEYAWFYQKFLDSDSVYARAFLSSIGYGDACPAVNNAVYNCSIAVSDKRIMGLPASACKLQAPKVRILIEGIDGSGKSTFATILLMYLKKLFMYNYQSQITVTGQPCSTLPQGELAKKFVEELIGDESSEVIEALTQNRIASEKMLAAMPGLLIVVRSFVTDYGTVQRRFGLTPESLGEGTAVDKWDYFLITDSDTNVCDERIRQRGKPRTWRESRDNLEFFRQFFLNFTSPLLPEKRVIKSQSMEKFHIYARTIALEIYKRTVTAYANGNQA